MTSLSVQVSVESWGEDCGPKPKSFANAAPVSVSVQEKGGHLIFSKGNLRTDACGSPNPKVHSVLAKRTDVRWKRVCRTAADDPKFEEGEYVLTAVGSNRLEYSATSTFDWKLKADHCRARSIEQRVYVRAGQPPASVGSKADPDSTISTQPTSDVLQTPASATPKSSKCVSTGPAVELEISPKRSIIGPGERICLASTVLDREGCSLKNHTKISWTAKQNGKDIRGLVNRAGCFQSGDTAADAEGTYSVTARTGSLSASAEVTVVFEELGDLLAARLHPLDDIPKASDKEAAIAKTTTAAKAATAPTAQARPTTPPPLQKHTAWIWAAVAGLGGMLLAVLIAVIVLRWKRGATIEEDAEEDEWEEEHDARYASEVSEQNLHPSEIEADRPTSRERLSVPPTESRNRASTVKLLGMLCPTCGRTFDSFAKFCPHDKSPLSPIRPEMKEMITGKVCPKCFRGYDRDAQFCPHDAAALIPYSEWRLSKLPPSP